MQIVNRFHIPVFFSFLLLVIFDTGFFGVIIRGFDRGVRIYKYNRIECLHHLYDNEIGYDARDHPEKNLGSPGGTDTTLSHSPPFLDSTGTRSL